MSRSGVRMFTLVAVAGAMVVGVLGAAGVRVSSRARRPAGVAAAGEHPARRESPPRRTWNDEERAINESTSPALLPQIAALAQRQFADDLRGLPGAVTAPSEKQGEVREVAP